MTIGADAVERIRETLREKTPERGLSGATRFVLLTIFLLAAIALCLWGLDEVSAWEWLTAPATFLYANLLEYWAHRVPMHRPVPPLTLIFRGHSLQHHLFFTERVMTCDRRDVRFLLLPPYMILSLTACFIAPVAASLAWWLSVNVALLFAATALAYYLVYELLHAVYHLPQSHPIARLALTRRLASAHRLHHDHQYMTQYNFNITFPIGDWLFGTRRKPTS
jgi:sterol desaturase/sphingolipid hydroxylase (fatty acid hydroxylase superfamily)